MENIQNQIFNLVSTKDLSPQGAAKLLQQLNQQESGSAGSNVVQDDIAIIGMAGLLPAAANVYEFWENLKNGKNCIRKLPSQRLNDLRAFFGEEEDRYSLAGYLDEIDKFDSSFFNISSKEAILMDPAHRLFLETAWTSIEDAGYGGGTLLGTKTGVFVGQDHTLPSGYNRLVDESDPLALTGAYTGILASRLSYILNLRGPSLVLDAACTSGLLAIHTACRYLLDNEGDMAIAGGINAKLCMMKQSGFDIVESQSGEIKTFDKTAAGTLWGEGVCSFLLKRLSEAVADGDNIHAVIKGSSVNNDGTSNGITAPNPEAQEEVLVQAWKNAKIDPSTLSYIEAHGTGTVLGDPIEIRAINKAFSKYVDRKQFCAIGSVKTNIGHLVAASGTASIIKVIMSLKNNKIPASINFKEINPYLDLCNSPVYINDRLTEWERGDTPRRAGISSFGFSGTNCHMVIEEAPIPEPAADLAIPYLFVLSAKTLKALQEMLIRYRDYFERDKISVLQDICYTLCVGRGSYNVRLAILAENRGELITKIKDLIRDGIADKPADGIRFGMHRVVPALKKNRDQGELTESDKRRLSEEANLQLKEAGEQRNFLLQSLGGLYVEGAEIEWSSLFEKGRMRVSLPTYPFAKVRHWAESSSIPDEITRMQEIELIHSLLGRRVSRNPIYTTYVHHFTLNKMWVLHDHRIGERSIFPGTGYMEMIRAAAAEEYAASFELRDFVIASPLVVMDGEEIEVHTIVKKESGQAKIVILSQTENGWIEHASAMGIETEDFIAPKKTYALEQEFEGFNPVATSKFFDFGPRWDNVTGLLTKDEQILIRLALPERFASDLEELVLHPALLDNALNMTMGIAKKDMFLPFSYNRMRIYGRMPERFYSYVQSRRGMDGKRETLTFDIDLAGPDGVVFMRIEGYTIKKVHSKDFILGRKDLFYELGWKRRELAENADTWRNAQVLVLGGEDQRILELCARLKDQGAAVTLAELGATFSRIAEDQYQIGATEADYIRLLDELRGRQLTHVIHLASLGGPEVPARRQELEDMQTLGIYSLTRLVRALAIRGLAPEVLIGTDYAAEVTGAEVMLKPQHAALFGLARSIGYEPGGIRAKCVDIDDKATAAELLALLGSGEEQVALREGSVYTPQLQPRELSGLPEANMELCQDGVYVITGGSGGIGLALGKRLASYGVNLGLISRSGWLDGESEKAKRQREAVHAMEKAGVSVTCLAADVSREEELEEALQKLRSRYGRINGIIHGAGVGSEGYLVRKEEEAMRRVMDPKITGTWLLDRLTAADPPDFLVLFSSVVALIGGPGQGDYAAANAYMDTYAAARNRRGMRTLTINWPAWKETGMAVDFGVNEDLWIFRAIETEKALDALEQALAETAGTIAIGELQTNGSVWGTQRLLALSPELEQRFAKRRTSPGGHVRRKAVVLTGRTEGSYSVIEQKVAQAWGEVLGLEEADLYTSFFDLGGDSIQGIKIANLLGEAGIAVDVGDLFEHLTIVELASFLEQKEREHGERPAAKDTEDTEDTTIEAEEADHRLSHAQERIWFLQKMDPRLVAYNLPSLINLEREMDADVLTRAFQRVIQRHDALRTVFLEEAGIPRQQVLALYSYSVEWIDLSAEEQPEAALHRLVKVDDQTVFDLKKPPYMMKLYRLGKNRSCLYSNFHHIIVDGWSLSVIQQEVIAAYAAEWAEEPQPPQAAPVQYAEHVRQQRAWLSSREAKGMQAYWHNELGGTLPVLSLPTDYKRPALQTYNGSSVILQLDDAASRRLKAAAQELNITLHMLFLAGYAAVLHRLTEAEDLIIGVPVTVRNNQGLDQAVGLFINSVCVRLNLREVGSFQELAEQVRRKSIDAYKNSKYPFNLVVSEINPERDLSRSPLFSTMFQFYEHVPPANEGVSQYDLSLLCREGEAGIEIRLEYNTDLFRRETIAWYGKYLVHVLEGATQDAKAGLSELRLLNEAEEEELGRLFRGPETSPCSYTMHRLFEERVLQSPEHTAVVDREQRWSYGQLNEAANRVAHLLQEREGIRPGEPVGLLAESGMGLVVGMLGIL
ncbi:SDR family NAD(P)-dependent oxidoreductase, partial [Paenibacillus sp.]|uniref:SDR family NAD(P)-dependent oxidoreductase n=1 Tax=Paenibacillus sp. TaxID=58172 RepID=UPI00283268B4